MIAESLFEAIVDAIAPPNECPKIFVVVGLYFALACLYTLSDSRYLFVFFKFPIARFASVNQSFMLWVPATTTFNSFVVGLKYVCWFSFDRYSSLVKPFKYL